MKNHTIHPPRPFRQTPRQPARPRAADPIRRQAETRRLYPDFLALCLYPGMPLDRTDNAA